MYKYTKQFLIIVSIIFIILGIIFFFVFGNESKSAKTPGITTLPPGMTTLPPGITTLPPGITTLPPGMTTLPPGMTTLPPGMTTLPPVDTTPVDTYPEENPFETCYKHRGCALVPNSCGNCLGDPKCKEMLDLIQKEYEKKPENFNNKTIKDIQDKYNNANNEIYYLLEYLSKPTIDCWDSNEEGSYPEHWYDDPVEDRCPNDNECKPVYNNGLLDTEYYDCAQEKCSNQLELCESNTECLNMLENCNNLSFVPKSASSCFTDYGQVSSQLFQCTNQGNTCANLMNNTE